MDSTTSNWGEQKLPVAGSGDCVAVSSHVGVFSETAPCYQRKKFVCQKEKGT